MPTRKTVSHVSHREQRGVLFFGRYKIQQEHTGVGKQSIISRTESKEGSFSQDDIKYNKIIPTRETTSYISHSEQRELLFSGR